jgi:hypothetical protein
MEKIASFTVEVPYRSTGNIVTNKNIDFDIFKDGAQYTAAPKCDLEERRIASLPPELTFQINNGKPQSNRGAKEGNVELINRIADQLKEQGLVDGT